MGKTEINPLHQKVLDIFNRSDVDSLTTGEIRDELEDDTLTTIFLLQDMVSLNLLVDLGSDEGDNEYALP